MNDCLKAIQEAIESKYLSRSLKREGCRVYLDRMPIDRILIDADRALPAFGITGSRCDLILFLDVGSEDLLVVAPIELKRGRFRASEVSQQLQGGARFAERIVPVNCDSTCQPILFHGRGIHRVQHKNLNRQKIRYRGKSFSIKAYHSERMNFSSWQI